MVPVFTPGNRKINKRTAMVIWQRFNLAKIAIFVASLFVFILAITLMKNGASSLIPLLENSIAVANQWHSLGFGWLFAYVLMSGSPVAASALAFFDAGAIDGRSTFTMIAGSRLGASFLVFLLGFLYLFRGRKRASSLSMGLLSFMITGAIHLLSLFIGLVLLEFELLDGIQVHSSLLLNSLFDRIFNPVAVMLTAPFPHWAPFLLGLAMIMLSFSLFDRCLPQMALNQSQLGQVSRLVYQPWIMLLLGAAVTLLSMSVTVSLGILVPLNERGFIRRENVVPYMMGANITTFIDTLMAAVILDNPHAFTIVLAEIVSVAIVVIIILATAYGYFEDAILYSLDWVTATNRNVALFSITIVLIPVVLLLI